MIFIVTYVRQILSHTGRFQTVILSLIILYTQFLWIYGIIGFLLLRIYFLKVSLINASWSLRLPIYFHLNKVTIYDLNLRKNIFLFCTFSLFLKSYINAGTKALLYKRGRHAGASVCFLLHNRLSAKALAHKKMRGLSNGQKHCAPSAQSPFLLQMQMKFVTLH